MDLKLTGRRLAAALVALGATAATAQAHELGATAQPVGKLKPGQHRFWEDAFRTTSGTRYGTGPAPTLACGAAAADTQVTCLDYTLDVASGADRLRVALDHGLTGIDFLGENAYTLELHAPDGTFRTAAYTDFSDTAVPSDVRPLIGDEETGEEVAGAVQFARRGSAEAFVRAPDAGRWLVRVVGSSVIVPEAIRLRAKLEVLEAPLPGTELLPDLRMAPPFELKLSTSNCDLDATPYDTVRSELPTYGDAPGHCVRYSTGPENIGDGPLDLDFSVAEPGSLATDRPNPAGTVVQQVHRAGTTPAARPGAGRWEYHDEHQHSHYKAMAVITSYKVDDPVTGAVTEITPGRKDGWCTSPMNIAAWRRFAPGRPGDAPHNCGAPLGNNPSSATGGGSLGLEAGWADIYVYGTPGMSIRLGAEAEGRYLLRAEANPERAIRESRTANNVSYTYFEVKDGQLTVLERGYGEGPWDAKRELADDLHSGARSPAFPRWPA